MFTFYVYSFLIFASISRLEANIIFTSSLKTKTLFTSVDRVIETLEKYIKTEENRLENLESSLDDWVKERDSYAEKIELQLTSNHLSQFDFLNKLKQKWTRLQNEAKNNTAFEYISRMKINTTWPSDVDVFGMMDSIINLQNIHFMEADAFARGELNGVVTNTSFNYEECLMMTERCFETFHYKLALEWALASLERYSKEEIENEQQLSKLFYYVAYSAHVLGHNDLAFKSIIRYMEENSHDRKGNELQNAIYLSNPEKFESHVKKKFEISQQMINLCKKSTTPEELSHINHLRCRYKTESSEFLKIAPLKEEMLSFNPPLLLYRNVLHDSEIDLLKDKAKDKLQNITTPQKSTHRHHAIKMAYFENGRDDDLSEVNRKVQEMTFSSVNLKNGYRLYNFMAGGSYAHEEENRENIEEGVTITVIFHMNDVMQGGSTIFPRANITVKAEKGEALVLYDLPHNSSNDLPRYSSCSVLAGQKWTLMTQINS